MNCYENYQSSVPPSDNDPHKQSHPQSHPQSSRKSLSPDKPSNHTELIVGVVIVVVVVGFIMYMSNKKSGDSDTEDF